MYGAVTILLTLSACATSTETPTTPEVVRPLGTSVATNDQAALVVALTQEKNNANDKAAATAEIARADAQLTLNSANATLSAAQTQDQNNADVVAAQIAATAEIVRANAQATLSSAGSTQNAALTQQQYNLQVTEAAGTRSADAMTTQQNKKDLAASTQTAIANNIATQTQVAAATSQWYADQARQREEKRQGPIAFLWMWCLPLFIVILAGLGLWGFWRWLRIQQAGQRILNKTVGRLHAPAGEFMDHQQDDPSLYLGSDIDGRYQPTKPDDQVRQWLDEVKRQLLRHDKKDQNDNSDN